MHSFFESEQDITKVEQRVCLNTEESHHLMRVLRLKNGEIVQLLDGRGNISEAKIIELQKNNAYVQIVNSIFIPKSDSELILALAWGKENRRSFVLEKSVELEANELWFWQSKRSQFPLAKEVKATWLAQMIAGAKQCQNSWLPTITTLPKGVEELIEQSKDFEHKIILVEANYKADNLLDKSHLARKGKTIIVIGAEGGFSPEEVTALQKNGFLALSLGTRILRLETAAILALGLNWWAKNTKS